MVNDDRKPTMFDALSGKVVLSRSRTMLRVHPPGSELAGELVARAESLLVEHAKKVKEEGRVLKEFSPEILAEAKATRRGAAGLLRAAAMILEEL